MKAGTLKQFLLKKYPTSDYFDCPVPKHHWEVIQEYADDYARIQIEKHIESIRENPVYTDGSIDLESTLNNTPINLD